MICLSGMKNIRFTKEGYEELKKKYQNLIPQRKAAVSELQKARSMGDLSENGYYKSARAKLSSIDRNLRLFSSFLKQATIINKKSSSFADVGNTVALRNGKKDITYRLVGDLEANPSENKISLLSPLGRAIKNRKAGDKISIETPSGKNFYEIIKIS